MGAMGLDAPAKDGSSCLAMAESLRAALDLDFDSAAGVHFDPMTRFEHSCTQFTQQSPGHPGMSSGRQSTAAGSGSMESPY